MIDQDGNRVEGFETVRDHLIAKKIFSAPTLDSYLGHIARFIEFLYAAFMIGWPKGIKMDAIINTYEEYLVAPTTTSDDIAYKAAVITGRTESCGVGSLGVIESALTAYFRVASDILISGEQSCIFSCYVKEVVIEDNVAEKRRLNASRKFSSYLSDTPAKTKRKRSRLFKRTRIRQFGDPDPIRNYQHFPFEKIEALIDSGKTCRDRALTALLAAIGCREHEALQIRLIDISFINRTILLINPHTRDCPGLTDLETELLSWKGRSTPEIYFLEPWGDIFWAEVSAYMKHERVKFSGNDFLFQILIGETRGRPLFTSDRSSRNKSFRKRAESCGVHLPTGTAVHSLRHSFGVYALNYHPLANGAMGFELATVAKMMGHSDISNTKKYAKKDRELIIADLVYARDRMHMANRSQREILIAFHQQQLEMLTNDQSDKLN